MFNSSRASANSIINRVMSNANGIGISKSKSRDKSDIRGENGHKVSDKAHSIKRSSKYEKYYNSIHKLCKR